MNLPRRAASPPAAGAPEPGACSTGGPPLTLHGLVAKHPTDAKLALDHAAWRYGADHQGLLPAACAPLARPQASATDLGILRASAYLTGKDNGI